MHDWQLSEWRQKIAWVPQQPILFEGSLRMNLMLGLPENSRSDGELEEALRLACAWDFVRDLPGGLDSQVRRGGRNFSGGQRQRLALARAFVRRADLLILDDAFSALDYLTEEKLRQHLKDLPHHPAVILISQRVHAIKEAEQILLLDEGKQIACATHQTLLAEVPLYQEIVASQTDRVNEGGEG